METLTLRRQRFAEAYATHGNATKAALEAGYAESGAHVEGSRLLRDTKVRLEVERLLKDSAPIITRDVIVRELWRNHMACKPHEVEVPIVTKGGQVVGVRLAVIGDAPASNRALELLAKLGGMMVERAEVQVTVTRDVVESEIEKLEKQLAVNDPASVRA
jgi:phage terminase small subunit